MFHPRTLTKSWDDNENDGGSVNSNEAAASPRSSLGEPYEGWGESPPPPLTEAEPQADETVQEIKLDPPVRSLSDIE